MKKIIYTILFAKACTFLLIIFAYALLPFGAKYFYPNFRYPLDQKISLQTAFKTWDAQHYLFLSEKGYQKNIDSNAFSPLLPFLIHMGWYITKNSFWSGIMLSNIFSFFGFVLFFKLVGSITNEKVAYKSLIFLLVFPTSFYFSLIYTESLFFLLVMLFFLFLQKRKLFFAALISFLLPLVRLIGIAIIIPFVSSIILEYHKHALTDELVAVGKSLIQKKSLYLLFPLIGLLTAMSIFYFTTGNFFTQFTTQQNFISHYSFFSLFNPLFFFRALFTFPLALHGFTNSLLDRVFFLCFVGFLPFLFKRVTRTFFVYALLFGLLPVLGGSFMSYMRYMLVVFPLFIALGKMSEEKKYRNFTFPYLYVATLLQSLFIIMHSLNYWVA